MSRGGGRGGFRGGRGGGASGRPEAPMGLLSYADVQAVARKEGGPLYPTIDLPVLSQASDEEQRICTNNRRLAERMRASPYRLTEKKVADELTSYSDRYKPSTQLSTTELDKDALQLDKKLFPAAIWESYFEKKRSEVKKTKKKRNLDALVDGIDERDDADNASSQGNDSDQEAGEAEADYDEVEDEDDDYGQQYFDNGEGDDDDMGDGDGGGDGGDY